MVPTKDIPFDRSVYLFEIDDVLYPKRDYLLQIYYLFSNFVEYTEGRALAKELLEFMRQTYEGIGEDVVLERAIQRFELPDAYRENFERLKVNAHLPLKLILDVQAKELLTTFFQHGKQVGILTAGNPVEQLNKLKHVDWEELSTYLPQLKVFFIDELTFRGLDPIGFLEETYAVDRDQIFQITSV
ncbi:HAD family hydrolase [Sphingobacterium suaedae]|uniref:HAD family hydrolase n=1 Tax=Sphingobacterium suaedae TaxID=1686402 RepID=A0ABW5KIG8_9SPHI